MQSKFEDLGIGFIIAVIPDALEAGVRVGGAAMVERMKADVPVSDNNEEGHVHLIETIKDVEITRGVHEVSAGEDLPDWRAGFVEFGTVKMAAQPYITPAMTSPEVAEAIIAGVKRKLP